MNIGNLNGMLTWRSVWFCIALYGNTLQEVSRKFIVSELEKTLLSFNLAHLVHALKADLQELLPLVDRQDSINCHQSQRCVAIEYFDTPIAFRFEYGSIHKIDTNLLKWDQLLPKLLTQFADAVKSL